MIYTYPRTTLRSVLEFYARMAWLCHFLYFQGYISVSPYTLAWFLFLIFQYFRLRYPALFEGQWRDYIYYYIPLVLHRPLLQWEWILVFLPFMTYSIMRQRHYYVFLQTTSEHKRIISKCETCI